MRKFIFSIMLIIFIITLAACSSSKKMNLKSMQKSAYDASNQSKDVTLTIKEKVITSETDSISLILSNISDKQYIFGEQPILEVKSDGAWQVVPYLKTAAWDDIAYILPPGKCRELKFSMKDNYGRLNKGSYRVIKELSSEKGENTFSAAEFEVK
ncbi:MAG: hypothetical protein LIR50_22055 [Bacillota bacterium]|nr:hypothetical protein [Bacillota bacterium]